MGFLKAGSASIDFERPSLLLGFWSTACLPIMTEVAYLLFLRWVNSGIFTDELFLDWRSRSVSGIIINKLSLEDEEVSPYDMSRLVEELSSSSSREDESSSLMDDVGALLISKTECLDSDLTLEVIDDNCGVLRSLTASVEGIFFSRRLLYFLDGLTNCMGSMYPSPTYISSEDEEVVDVVDVAVEDVRLFKASDETDLLVMRSLLLSKGSMSSSVGSVVLLWIFCDELIRLGDKTLMLFLSRFLRLPRAVNDPDFFFFSCGFMSSLRPLNQGAICVFFPQATLLSKHVMQK